jgi:glutamate synthase (NADPH) small chain
MPNAPARMSTRRSWRQPVADPSGFLKYARRETPTRRPVELRLRDWKEVYEEFSHDTLQQQAARCMDCGIPFCHNGCPLGNLIPEWNDLVYRNRWRDAIERLHATNNFPEFTGRLCPAPCEASCVLGINQDPVTIKQVEVEIIDNAFAEGWVKPLPPDSLTGKTVAVVGSGPAGLAAAQQLTRAGHLVTVFERDDRIGGLLRYGIPEFKMEKRHIDRRLEQMEAEGTHFRSGVNVGVDISAAQLRTDFDAVVLAGGATDSRELPIRGRELDGIHHAMEFLPWANRVQNGDPVLGDDGEPPITAKGKRVVIIGGGDTGADCLGTVHRQGAKSVHQFEIMPRPPADRADSTPWPTYPLMFRVSSAHEEGGERVFSVNTEEFVGRDGQVAGLKVHEVTMNGGKFEKVGGTDFELEADLVLLAMGFIGPERTGLLSDLGVEFSERGNVARNANFETSVPGVFVAGDMGRGQSLIVWAIAEGRAAASGVDRYLMGRTALPAPIKPTAVPQR